MTTSSSTRSAQDDAAAAGEERAHEAHNTVIGGPLGIHASIPGTIITRGRWSGTVVPAWQPVAAVLALVASAMIALGVLQKSYCFTNGWGGDEVFWRACYSDLPNMLVSSGLASSTFPYSVDALTQPVGTGIVLWMLSFLAPNDPDAAHIFVGIWAVTAALLAIGLVIATVLTSRRTPWVATMIAVSPLLITVAMVGVDLIGVLLIAIALLLWSREQDWAAGAVFALAILSRTYALVVLVAVIISALRAGQYRSVAKTVGVAVAGSVAVLVAFRSAGFDVGAAYGAWIAGSPEFGSLTYLATLAGHELSATWATVIAVGGWVAALIIGALVGLGAQRRPMIAETAIIMLVIIMLTAKAVPPQWALWLLPLVALARLPWKVYVAWMATECVYFVMVWMHVPAQSSPTRALPDEWYAFFLVLRLTMLVALAVCTYRQAMLRPIEVRAANEEAYLRAEIDDAAGPSAGQRDRLVVTF